MIIHAITAIQSAFTISVSALVLAKLRYKIVPDYVRYWIWSYFLLSLITAILIDIHREIQYFWIFGVLALTAFILGDIALWKYMKSVLEEER